VQPSDLAVLPKHVLEKALELHLALALGKLFDVLGPRARA